jgi:7-cyano-7-deazaguanine synthase
MRTVLLSGGVDSAVVLHMVVERYGKDNLLAVSFDYGQPHRKELECAQRLSDRYGVKWKCISLRDVFSVSPSGLLDPSADLKKFSNAVVKNRNFIFLAAASGFSETIFIGSNKDDYADFVDCRPETLATLGFALEVKIKSPLSQLKKTDVVDLATKFGLPVDELLTCYKGVNCGECASCLLLSEACGD